MYSSTTMDRVGFYCVTFQDDARRVRMEKRFEQHGLFLTFVDPVLSSDPRLADVSDSERRTAAVMLQHMDSLRHFVEETNYEYCVVCEDDIHLHKEFRSLLHYVLKSGIRSYDIVLLGYLWHEPIYTSSFQNAKPLTFWKYHNELWGSQMYIVTRSHAERLVARYRMPTLQPSVPYSPDWTITKDGNRALCVPMLAVEEGHVKTTHAGQRDYHRMCHLANMNESYV